MKRKLIAPCLALLLICTTLNSLWAQTISASDSVLFQAIVEADLTTLKAQLNASKDSFGLPYLQAMSLAAKGQTQPAIDSLQKAAMDSRSPYQTPARSQLLKVYASAGQYKQYCQFADQIQQPGGWYEDARLFTTYSPTQINFINTRDSISFQLRRKSYVIVRVRINGRPARFMLERAVHKLL